MSVSFRIDLEREDDGRWIGEISNLPGVLCYGATRDQAVARVQALALRVLAERREHAEAPAETSRRLLPRGVSTWPSTRARRVLAALTRIGWLLKAQSGSHRISALAASEGGWLGRPPGWRCETPLPASRHTAYATLTIPRISVSAKSMASPPETRFCTRRDGRALTFEPAARYT